MAGELAFHMTRSVLDWLGMLFALLGSVFFLHGIWSYCCTMQRIHVMGTETTTLIDYLDFVTVKRSRARKKEKERKDLYLIRDGEFRIPLLVGSLPIVGKMQN